MSVVPRRRPRSPGGWEDGWPQVERASWEAFAAVIHGEHRMVGGSQDDGLMAVQRWFGDADAADEQLLSRCRDSTVDIGCGPGRMTHALLERGLCALGIDVLPEAVELTRARGGMAVLCDVFATMPGEGRWNTALVADGNIGIGGDPRRLLRRLGDILASRGQVIVDVKAPGGPIEVRRVSREIAGCRTEPLRWASVPANRLEELARDASMTMLELVQHESRWFATLEKRF